MKPTGIVPSKKTALAIAFVSNSCWSIYNFRLEVVKHFVSSGYEVHIIAGQDDFAPRLMDAGCKVHSVHFNNRDKNPVSNIKLYWQLKRLYAAIRPQLIFHYVIKPNIYGSLAAGKLGIPSIAVITGLGYAFSSENLLFKIVCRLYRVALKRVSAVWFLNEEDAAYFKAKEIVKPGKIHILHSEGINTEKFIPVAKSENRGAKPFVFLMLTRMLWSKGVGILAEAASILKQRGYYFECRVMGFFEPHHPDTISLEDFQRWKDNDTFIYDGFAQDVLPHLQEADCFVLPSFYKEGVPRSLLEACSVQLPVITTNQTGCREVVIHGINGLLCNANDAADLAEKMQQMMALTDEQRSRMGEEGRKIAMEKFDINLVTEVYEKAVIAYT